MLEKLFEHRDSIERLHGNPFAPHLDSFAALLAADAYAVATVREKLRWVGQLGWWLEEKKLTVAQLDERLVDRFLSELRGRGRLCRGQGPTTWRFLAYLQSQGVIPCPEPVCDTSPLAELERHYERHLRTERGLTTATVVNYAPVVHRFLVHHFGDGPLHLEELKASDISTYVLAHAHS